MSRPHGVAVDSVYYHHPLSGEEGTRQRVLAFSQLSREMQRDYTINGSHSRKTRAGDAAPGRRRATKRDVRAGLLVRLGGEEGLCVCMCVRACAHVCVRVMCARIYDF